jgi:Zn-dependent peptidase ImmA (M78 family)/DNA-binding XRE family transcriptional regulator
VIQDGFFINKLSISRPKMEKNILNNIDSKILGTRLQEARKARGYTQQDVAEKMDMVRTTLVAIEKGERRVTPHEMIRFAAIYGRPVSELVSNREVIDSFVPQFRSNWREDITEDSSLEQTPLELQKLAEDYVELEKICEMPQANLSPPLYTPSGASPEQVAEEIATAERNRLGIGDGPISNLRERLESDVGLRIFYFAMPTGISGVFAYNDLLGGCIGINSNHPKDRRAWSLAHEYEHFLTARYRAEITFLAERRRQSSSERRADAFAENFLMPASGLNRRFTEMHRSSPSGSITLAQICTLADLYQVSVQAMILRLENLRRLPVGTWDDLEARGFKPRRAQQLLEINTSSQEEPLLPKRYLNLAVIAWERELLSEGQLAKMLRSDRVSARILVEQISGRFNAEADTGYERLDLDLAQPLFGK